MPQLPPTNTMTTVVERAHISSRIFPKDLLEALTAQLRKFFGILTFDQWLLMMKTMMTLMVVFVHLPPLSLYVCEVPSWVKSKEVIEPFKFKRLDQMRFTRNCGHHQQNGTRSNPDKWISDQGKELEMAIKASLLLPLPVEIQFSLDQFFSWDEREGRHMMRFGLDSVETSWKKLLFCARTKLFCLPC